MTENLHGELDELARQRGLGEAYYDYRGELKYFSKEARVAILKAMGVPVEGTTTPSGPSLPLWERDGERGASRTSNFEAAPSPQPSPLKGEGISKK